MAQGDRVVVIGDDTTRVKAPGKSIDYRWTHAFTVRNGKVVAFEEYGRRQRARCRVPIGQGDALEPFSPCVAGSAVRALEVTVLDDRHRRVPRPADVIARGLDSHGEQLFGDRHGASSRNHRACACAQPDRVSG